MKKIFFPILLIAYLSLSISILSCNSTDSTAHGLDESTFAQNSTLKASLNNVVAVHLEHPSGGLMTNDTGGTGYDIIPYTFDLKPGGESVSFCFTSDLPHNFNLLDSNQQVIQSFEPNGDCTAVTLNSGLYYLEFVNATTPNIQVSNLFIRLLSRSSPSKTLLINSNCDNCDLSGVQMQDLDFSNKDFTGANFDGANLSGNNFQTAHLNNASFFGANITNTLFAAEDSIFLGETLTQEWTTQDGAYTLLFHFYYSALNALPQITLTLLDSNAVELNSQTFNSDNELTLALPYFQGDMNIQDLNLNSTNNNEGIFAQLCWGSSLNQCFQGVLLSFYSFSPVSSNLAATDQVHTLSDEVVELNLINESNDMNNNDIVIFQTNNASPNGSVIAWQVIENLGQGDNHPFIFSRQNYLASSDSFGNFTPQLLASNGQLFSVSQNLSGDTLTYYGASTSTQEIQILNNLTVGSINADLYKDDRLLSVINNIVPAQKGVFQMNENIYIGVVSNVVEGQVLSSATVSQVTTQLSLLGILSADIVMTGGATGPFQFSLANISFR